MLRVDGESFKAAEDSEHRDAAESTAKDASMGKDSKPTKIYSTVVL